MKSSAALIFGNDGWPLIPNSNGMAVQCAWLAESVAGVLKASVISIPLTVGRWQVPLLFKRQVCARFYLPSAGTLPTYIPTYVEEEWEEKQQVERGKS